MKPLDHVQARPGAICGILWPNRWMHDNSTKAKQKQHPENTWYPSDMILKYLKYTLVRPYIKEYQSSFYEVVCRCSLWVQDLSHGADGIGQGHAPIMALGRGECSMFHSAFYWDLRLFVCKCCFQLGEFLRCFIINSLMGFCVYCWDHPPWLNLRSNGFEWRLDAHNHSGQRNGDTKKRGRYRLT